MGPGRGSTGSGPSHCPSPVPQGSSYVQTNGIMAHTYIRTIILNDMDIPLRRLLGLSGWGYADFNAGVNFAFTEFSEVRCFLGALAHIHSPQTGVCCVHYVVSRCRVKA